MSVATDPQEEMTSPMILPEEEGTTQPEPLPLRTEENQPVKVLVIGGGFGGLTFCQKFAHPDASLVLIDRQNHHLFQPLLYQVATAMLTAPDIAQPIRAILRDKKKLTVILGEVRQIDLARRQVVCRNETFDYDFLVLAFGAVTSYFNHPEWERFALGLKTVDDALAIRRSLLVAFERAETARDSVEQRRLMTIVVVGGGATGVELSGACAELAKRVLTNDFRRIDPSSAHIMLIEGGPRLMPAFAEDLSANAKKKLEEFGVQVCLGMHVKDIRAGEVELADGTVIGAETIVWAAGVAANPLTRQLGLPADLLDKGGRIKVNHDLSLPEHPEVFAIGDIVSIIDPLTGHPVPGVSPAAIQMGAHVANTISNDIDAREINLASRIPFSYWDKGTMATIGRKAAVVMKGKLKLTGFIAWIAWLFVHIFFLIGFRNKLSVIAQWAYSYLTYKRSARVITGMTPSEAGMAEAARQKD